MSPVAIGVSATNCEDLPGTSPSPSQTKNKKESTRKQDIVIEIVSIVYIANYTYLCSNMFQCGIKYWIQDCNYFIFFN